MTGTSTVVGASMLAHGLHAAIVLLGLWGLAALLLPHALDSASLRRSRHRGATLTVDLDEHALRVAELRAAVASGSFASPRPASGVVSASSPRTATTRVPQPALGLPLALVAGTAAASIHAAVIPAHLLEEPLLGLFFLLAAATQLGWVVTLAARPTATALRLGIALQGALVALWLVTRLVGLPFGLLPEPHPVGAWDVACVLWQLTCIASCTRVLQQRAPAQVSGWFEWHPTTRAAVGAAPLVMVLLAVVGAHS